MFYRFKTAFRNGRKNDPTLSSGEFRHGLIVWVDGPQGREQRICTGKGGEVISPEEHKRRKEQRAATNRAQHGSRRSHRVARDRSSLSVF